MRYGILFLSAVLPCAGCTTLALERQSVSQASSPTDIRFQEVLNNLAMLAEDPHALPSYASIFAGTAQISDSFQLASATTLSNAGSEGLTPQFSRGVSQNWTLDPINVPEKLEAIRAACRWVLYGPEFACHDCPGLLESPYQFPCPGRHFGVRDRLASLPQGCIHTGKLCDVPMNARYRAHSGNTWVWVMPEDVKLLADLNLVLQDIARVDINSPTLQYIRPFPSDFLFPTLDRKPEGKYALKCNTEGCADQGQLYRYPVSVVAEVSVDPCYTLMPDTPYYKWRTENLGSDSLLRSTINAAGLH
jgi:hypothetical protein